MTVKLTKWGIGELETVSNNPQICTTTNTITQCATLLYFCFVLDILRDSPIQSHAHTDNDSNYVTAL